MGEKASTTKKKHNRLKILGCVVAVVAVLGVGFWVWHTTPGFCGTLCHDSMNEYVVSYDQASDSEGVDKWGNAVADTGAMLAVTHKAANLACLDCHVPTLGQQVGEVVTQVSGNYEMPLDEIGVEELMKNSGNGAGMGDAFCLKSGCHDGTRSDLTALTADLSFNPHDWHHDDIECSDCHKSHRASVLYCTECHGDAAAVLPDGWVTYETSMQISEAA